MSASGSTGSYNSGYSLPREEDCIAGNKYRVGPLTPGLEGSREAGDSADEDKCVSLLPETQHMVLQSALVKWASLGSPQCLLNKKRIDISRSFNILPVCKPEVGFCISVMVKSEANIGVCF